MSKDRIRIATRKSPLALWQAEHVRSELERHHPGLTVELVTMTTKGDKILDSPLAKVGGKGLFIKELEQGMLEGTADIAVHSMKDVTAVLPEEFVLAVICEREDPRDAFVSGSFASFRDLPQGARVGTCSLRRQCQIKEMRPDLKVIDLRGNVNTRLRKLDDGEFDAIVLATAGLVRLGFFDRIRERIAPETSLPAVGQGAVGIECRAEDSETRELLAPLEHRETRVRVSAERAMNARLEGGCQVPIGGFAELQDGTLRLRGFVGRPDGTLVIRADVSGPEADAERIGSEMGEDLLSRGADRILRDVLDSN